jgi:hypothetical protein
VDLIRIALRIATGKQQGWLYIDGHKFIPHPIYEIHGEVAAHKVLIDSGAWEIAQQSQHLVPRKHKDNQAEKLLMFLIVSDPIQTKQLRKDLQPLLDEIFQNSQLTEEKLDQYIKDPVGTYFDDYRAIRVNIVEDIIYLNYSNWDLPAVRAIQSLIKDNPQVEQVVFESGYDYKTHPVEDVLKWQGTGRIFS